MDSEVKQSAGRMMNSAVFGQIIISNRVSANFQFAGY